MINYYLHNTINIRNNRRRTRIVFMTGILTTILIVVLRLSSNASTESSDFRKWNSYTLL
ncbi:MAG: hypothetical protein K0R00_2037 [Herbinix sp.]|jgi:hypothetical protein|nr:hypothetical protein [Herbinix sp.]